MTRASILALGRAAAEEGMVDSCTIARPGDEITDPDTDEVTTTFDQLYTAQKCRVQSRGFWAQLGDVGEAARNIAQLEVQLPIAVTGVRVSDHITIDTSVHDPELVGRTFIVKDLSHKSHATARRLMCLETTG